MNITEEVGSSLEEVSSGLSSSLGHLREWIFGGLALGKLVAAALILLGCLLASKAILRLVRRGAARSRLDGTLQTFLLRLLKVFLVALSAMIAAQTLGIDVTSLVAVLGVASLAISLALQGTLSILVGGVMLLTAKPFSLGDFIECGTYSGTVQAIGLFYTTLMTYDNKEIFMPNSTLSGSTIVNYSAAPKRLVEITVSAAYECGAEQVKAALREAIAGAPGLLPDEPITTVVSSYNPSDISYLLRCWVESSSYFAAKFAITDKIKLEFERRSIVFSYPHLNVHLNQ